MKSVAMTTDLADRLRRVLLRTDGQEDLRFLIWHGSDGLDRTTALIADIVDPADGDRFIHGNASFSSSYFERALDAALDGDTGLGFVHSHPLGTAWQDLSRDDRAAEADMAAAVLAATGRPLVGLTLAGDGSFSARFWPRGAGTTCVRRDCDSVRVVGDRLEVSFNPALQPTREANGMQARTISAWGLVTQSTITRLRVGVVGLGSVGSLVAEGLGRMGVTEIRLIDFDSVREVNLDRLLHATPSDARNRRSKVSVASRALTSSSTAVDPKTVSYEYGVTEEQGHRAALDCDVLFSCVDRPWARSVLNFIAYAHLIPVVDGGVRVRSRDGFALIDADWRGHIAAPGRRCLACLGQFDPGLVAVERSGHLDRPGYIDGLPEGHELKARENVFAFSMGAASLQLNQFIAMVAAPAGVADLGALHFHLTSSELTRVEESCDDGCPYGSPPILAGGDDTPFELTGPQPIADEERAYRAATPSATPRHLLDTLRSLFDRS